jgi:thiamine-phosphate pyrophosphorylase
MNEDFGLYLIATDPVAGYERVARAAVDCSVRYLQLRMKDKSCEDYIRAAARLREITRGTGTRLIVNDNLDVAMEIDADGVHLGQTDLSVTEARRRWNTPGKIFGLSTHSMQQAANAAELQPDYIGIGPVFPTRTKSDAATALGPEEAGAIARQSAITPVAIGGINAENLPGLLKQGVVNFCVVSAVNSRPDPFVAIQDLQKIWKSHVF